MKIMPKKGGETKIGISISLEETLLKDLDKFCKENYNAERSEVIGRELKKFLEENGKK